MATVRYRAGAFPPDDRLRWRELIPVIGPAAAAVARYDGILASIPNPDVLLAPFTLQEAVMSSRIEGIHATLSDVLRFEAGQAPESAARRDDIQEVLNYRRASRWAETQLADIPLSLRLIRKAHAILMDGARGHGKAPGEFRRVPNWIGPPGCTIERARFVPIGADALPDAMAQWERYIHSDAPDKLVQLAILHAEFEALHPFLDGNGRLGRMLVPLFLWQANLIRSPRFYISACLEARRNAYYDGLLAVSRDDDWTGWCRFFLEAINTQAEDDLAKMQSILNLYEEMKFLVPDLTGSRYAIHALDWIFRWPIFTSTTFLAGAGIPVTMTARRVLSRLTEAGVLTTIRKASGKRPALFAYVDVMEIAEGQRFF
ncbi:Fic family protein [Candidatus Foliamicus sp.]